MRNLLLAGACAAALHASAQVNIGFVGRLDYQALRNSNLSNLWGYTDEEGTEYALVGVCGTGGSNPGGLSVVSLADPANPTEIFFFPGPASIWREIKVWGDHAYVTTEAAAGELTIVDLSPLPQSTDLPAIVWDAPGWSTSHSLFIDENGRLYLHGANRGNGGVIMYDLTQDPMNPVEIGEFDNWYCHDSFARGDTLYAAHIYDGFFSIVNVSDPASPVLLGTKHTPSDFTHNTWLDASGRYLFTTDERTNAYVGAYDISDPTDITEAHRLRSDNGSGAIPHNTYWLNGYAITSYYTYGVSIYDVSDPHNMVEVGSYDTSPFSGDGFNGAWGVYPFFPSGNLIISDMERGLFVLAPTYVQACRLEGTVTNAVTGAPVGNATVQITGLSLQDVTGVDGVYGTGYHTAGTYTVTASAPGYFASGPLPAVLVNGQVTVLDIALQPMVPFTVTGTVTTAGSGEAVAGATVQFVNPTYAYSAITQADGSYTLSGVFADSYAITAGRWGWGTVCIDPQPVNPPGNAVFNLELPRGYADDFALDLGWTTGGTASSGFWVREAPVGTVLGGTPANPGADVPGDCGDMAYVTGNAGGAPGNDDVDGGTVVLTSPLFDATEGLDPHVRYQRWFFNGGGSGSPNDQLTIALSNGLSTVTIESVNASNPGNSTWVQRDLRIADFLPPTSSMRIIVTAADNEPGHVVEAGFDAFKLRYELGSGVPERVAQGIAVFPNPAHDAFTLRTEGPGLAVLVDAAGREVWRARVQAGDARLSPAVEPGAYVLRFIDAAGRESRAALVIQR